MQVRHIWYVASSHKCLRALMHWKNTVRHQNQQFSPTPLGKSLVTAYENLNIDLARPAIRARMESDMNEIAHGRKSRRDVVKDWMGIMTPLLKQCMDKVGQLKGTLRTFFQVLCPLALSPYMRAFLLDPLARSLSASRQRACSRQCALFLTIPHSWGLRMHTSISSPLLAHPSQIRLHGIFQSAATVTGICISSAVTVICAMATRVKPGDPKTICRPSHGRLGKMQDGSDTFSVSDASSIASCYPQKTISVVSQSSAKNLCHSAMSVFEGSKSYKSTATQQK